MRTTTKEKISIHSALTRYGINYGDACQLRRISMTLHNWYEKECGDGVGCIERDEESNLPYWLNSMTNKKYRIADKETGALKRLARIMENYPTLTYYVQTDPRGASLYILNKSDVEGMNIESVHNRGIAVY